MLRSRLVLIVGNLIQNDIIGSKLTEILRIGGILPIGGVVSRRIHLRFNITNKGHMIVPD